MLASIVNQSVKVCWICGAPASTREHRLKKSDIVRAYGRGPYLSDTGPIHFRGGKSTKIQGPNSQAIQYSKILCADCNTTRSQPYDFSHERFMDWLFSNERTVLQRRFVNFYEVYGEDWQTSQLNLYKYFAKSFGCRLTEASHEVPEDVVSLFPRTNFQTALRMTFSVNEDVLLLPQRVRNGLIGKAALVPMARRDAPSEVVGFTWNEYASWFTVHYWYNECPDGNLGSTWVADTQHVYLGSVAPLPSKMRADLAQKSTLLDERTL